MKNLLNINETREEPKEKLTAEINLIILSSLAPQLETPEWKSISATAKDLVLKMLAPNPLHRPSVAEVLDHPWMRVSVMCHCAICCQSMMRDFPS